MATGGNAIRGTRVGSGPMGEQDHGYHADRIAVSYWDGLGNETVRYFAAGLPEEEIPETIDHPQSGLPAGRDKENPPALAKAEPYKDSPRLREGASYRRGSRPASRRCPHAVARAPGSVTSV